MLRPGGSLVVMNHFSASDGARAAVEQRMERAAAWLGWHPNFPYDAVGDWIASRPDARVVERRELPPLKLFTLLRIEKARRQVTHETVRCACIRHRGQLA